MMKTRRSNGDKIVVNANTKTKLPKERPMNNIKYIGMDVHMAMTVVAVLNDLGKVVAEAIIETKGSTIVSFLKGLRGELHVTFEECTQAAWLYDLIRPQVATVVVCNPKKIPTQETKADKIDARRLAELLRTNGLKAVYHGEHSTQAVKDLAQSYGAIVSDSTRVRNRLKALFRGRGIPCHGTSVYNKEEREQWLKQLDNASVRVRAGRIFRELDFLTELREEAETEFIRETRKHSAAKILQSIPGIGPLRAGVILGFAVTPHRFRTRKQFWTYCGLAVTSKVTSEYAIIQGQVRRSKQQPLVRGLNRNYNRSLKEVFKGAAATAAMGPWRSQFDAMVANGMRAPLALLTLARKISSTTLTLWKKGEPYDEKKLKFMHAV
jgi:transposase